MPRVYRVNTALGITIELELVEKTRNTLVLKDAKTGRLYKLNVKRAGDGKYLMDINGELYSVFSSKEQGVFVNTEPLLVTSVSSFEVKEETSAKPTAKPAPTPLVEPGVVQSPISGRVIEVRVKPGSRVGKGDVLLLMESMKMVIEVKSDIEGVVEEVFVSSGKAVNKGEKLVRIRPS